MSNALGELKLWIVCYVDDDSDPQDQFVTAYTAEEAFAMWRRVTMEIDPADYGEGEDRTAQVFEVPQCASKPTIHGWYDSVDGRREDVADFQMSRVTLTTMAVDATFTTVVTPLGVSDDLSALCSVVPDDRGAGV